MKALALLLVASTAYAEPSLPWQLRPLTTDNLLRADTAAAVFNDDQGNVDIADSTVLAATYQLTHHWASTMRIGFVANNAPGAALDGSALVNPLVGATYTGRSGVFDYALTFGTTLPIGNGSMTTNTAAARARPADAAMFAGNDLTPIVGADIAYARGGFIAQAEATLEQGIRVRGMGDRFETNASIGLHAGYFIGSHFSLSGDVRYDGDVTAAIGPRAHFRVGGAWFHPGISYTRGLDTVQLMPTINAQTNAVQIDVPVLF